ncbi:hypothetical protein BDZ45DRAFT_709909 [Acephala macrosclerotiorum]|nr:hypothetical protein BDZ45DRAFT_709909 [Acephala macrosclerotiorum]
MSRDHKMEVINLTFFVVGGECTGHEPGFGTLSSPEHLVKETQVEEVRKLGFCQLRDWDEEKTYDERPPKHIHYSINWSFKIHGRVQSKNTELDLVLVPASYWRLYLKPKLEQVCLSKMRAKKRTVESEDTKVVLKVTQRSVDNVTKSFDKTDIDWSVIEKQLTLWADRFPDKGLTIDISFNYNYVETGPLLAADVYSIFRCPGPPCNLGPHCWVDPIIKKHYKLKWHHFKEIIKLVEQGYHLEVQDDMPEKIRLDLYAEEQQRLEKQQKPSSISAANAFIHIINTLPTSSYQTCHPRHSPAPTASSSIPSIDIPGFRDEADPEKKAPYATTRDIIIKENMDLEILYQDPDPTFLIEGDVKRAPALHIVRDIGKWVQKSKRRRTEEQLE